MGIKILKRKIAQGKISLYLDISRHGLRKQECLGLIYKESSSTLEEREEKKLKLDIAKKIQAQRELSYINDDHGIDGKLLRKVNFFEYAQMYIERKAPITDVRCFRSVVNKLKAF